ncbi:MAG: response regulator [Gammaproteobacteria bacterium]|nr:response regulator [Gammaproteobacteria bacterium]
MGKKHILIVEDEGLVAEDIKAHLEDFGYHVVGITATGEDALQILQGTEVDLVIMDIVLAGKVDGISTAEKIKTEFQIPVIYLTSYTDREKIERASATDPYGYLVKPFDERELKTTVAMALSKSVNDRAIRDGKRWVTAVLNSIEDGVITIDHLARVRDMNPQSEALLNCSFSDSRDKQIMDIFHFAEPEIQSNFANTIHFMLQLKNRGEHRYSGVIERHKQDDIHIELNLTRIFFGEDNIVGIVLTFRDITLQQQAKSRLENYSKELENEVNQRTAELLQAKHRAEAANVAKSQFLSRISHELITPLNPAMGYAQILMMDKSINQVQRQYAQEIHTACGHLLSMMKGLIELSRIETNSVKLNLEAFNPAEVVHSTLQAFKHKAAEKKLALESHIDADLPMVIGDAKLINTTLNLLTDNAIKFTSSGGVNIRVSQSSASDEQICLCFSVEDSGPGISPDLEKSIFESFNQLDESSTRKHQGMGIGLTLSKRLIEYMNGKIGIDAVQPQGARFWFELTLPKA